MVRGAPLLVHYWADLQSVYWFPCCNNTHVYNIMCQRCNANVYRSTLMLFGQLPVKFNKTCAERETFASACVLSWLVTISHLFLVTIQLQGKLRWNKRTCWSRLRMANTKWSLPRQLRKKAWTCVSVTGSSDMSMLQMLLLEFSQGVNFVIHSSTLLAASYVILCGSWDGVAIGTNSSPRCTQACPSEGCRELQTIVVDDHRVHWSVVDWVSL